MGGSKSLENLIREARREMGEEQGRRLHSQVYSSSYTETTTGDHGPRPETTTGDHRPPIRDPNKRTPALDKICRALTVKSGECPMMLWHAWGMIVKEHIHSS